MAEFEHENTEEIVCPWCGYQYQDSWEFEDAGTVECDGCDKGFKFSRFTDISYDTEKEEPND